MNWLIYAVGDVKFGKDNYVELFIAKSKTDICRNGNESVLLARILC